MIPDQMRELSRHSFYIIQSAGVITLKLPDSFINILVELSKRGMGYPIVNVILRSGKILHVQKVPNSEFLMLEENEITHVKVIEK